MGSPNQQALRFHVARRLPLRVNNVARRLCRTERTVRHLASTQKINAFKIDGKSWGFWPDEVERYRRLMETRDLEARDAER